MKIMEALLRMQEWWLRDIHVRAFGGEVSMTYSFAALILGLLIAAVLWRVSR